MSSEQLAATLAARTPFSHRAAILPADRDDMLAALDALATGQPATGLVTGTAADLRPVLIFPGQGSQWPGMAQDLGHIPAFARHPGRMLSRPRRIHRLVPRLGPQ